MTENRHWHLDYAKTRLLMTLCVGEIAFLIFFSPRAAWQPTNCVAAVSEVGRNIAAIVVD